ncbi:hypothetical protein EDC01DRAFT_642653 [Geopyxis carbonaria]|nr:hypothetical protein EDC01DRAFT_642653 [Geopyxis carbonaria]
MPGKPNHPAPPTDCPKTLPKCLNSWLFTTKCSDNASPSCYCPDAKFVEKISDCLYARGESADETAKAVEYFLGLCQEHIPSNPAIVSAIPPQVTLPPPAAGVPVTTIVRTVTTVVPCQPTTLSEGPSSGVVVSSTTSSVVKTVTIPRVTFTVTAGEPALAYPTGGDTPATAAPVPTGPAPTAAPPALAGPTTLITAPASAGYAAPTGGFAGNSSSPGTTAPPTQFEGAAASVRGLSGVFGVVLAAMAFAL